MGLIMSNLLVQLQFHNKRRIMKKFALILTVIISIIVTGCSNYPYLGDGYRFNQIRQSLCIVDSENYIVIGSEILKYAFDSNFIIAAQRPWDSVPNIKNMTYYQSNKAFARSTFLQYWIIYKKKKDVPIGKSNKYSNVYGPYKRDAYLAKKKELGVPDNLKLKSVK